APARRPARSATPRSRSRKARSCPAKFRCWTSRRAPCAKPPKEEGRASPAFLGDGSSSPEPSPFHFWRARKRRQALRLPPRTASQGLRPALPRSVEFVDGAVAYRGRALRRAPAVVEARRRAGAGFGDDRRLLVAGTGGEAERGDEKKGGGGESSLRVHRGSSVDDERTLEPQCLRELCPAAQPACCIFTSS